MATEIVKTIRASGGDYTTLSAWEAALPADLTAVDEQHTAVCYDDWSSGLSDTLTISGSVTDATRFIKVAVADGHGHGGIPDAGFWMTGLVTVSVLYTKIIGLQVISGGHCFVTTLASDTIVHDSCLAKITAAGTYVGFSGNHANNSVYQIYANCLAIGVGGYGQGYGNISNYSRGRCSALNCVASGFATGFQGLYATVKNCVGFGNTVDFSSTQTAPCASSDATATYAGSITNITSTEFVDSANNDFHLVSGSALIGAGANLYGTFTHDIDGDIRPSSGAWDIGFDHYAAAASAVYSDLSDAYAIRAAASSDISDSYAIRSAIAADLADSYSVRSAVLADLADTYGINAGVSADLLDGYIIRAIASSDLVDSYAIAQSVAADLSDSYEILADGTVTSDLADSYAIRAAIASDLADSYAIRAAVSSDMLDSYSIRSAVSTDLADEYAIVVAAISDLADIYAIRSAVSADLADSYSIGEVAVSCPSAADIAAAILAAAQITPIHSDIQKVLSHQVDGTGTELDPWGPA